MSRWIFCTSKYDQWFCCFSSFLMDLYARTKRVCIGIKLKNTFSRFNKDTTKPTETLIKLDNQAKCFRGNNLFGDQVSYYKFSYQSSCNKAYPSCIKSELYPWRLERAYIPSQNSFFSWLTLNFSLSYQDLDLCSQASLRHWQFTTKVKCESQDIA